MDLLLLVNNLLVLFIYLALAVVLWAVSRSAVVLVLALGFVQMAAYVASNPAVELLTLARAHDRADAAAQAVLEGAGEVLLAGWTGTAYLVYYFLGAFVLLLLAWLLHRTTAFPPSAAWWALAAGVLMLVPASFGLVGLLIAFVSLIPWSIVECLVSGDSRPFEVESFLTEDVGPYELGTVFAHATSVPGSDRTFEADC